MGFDNLPFPRGTVLPCESATEFNELVGNIYTVKDTVHNSGGQTKLRCCRYVAATSLTMVNRAVEFDTGKDGLGREVKKVASGHSVVSKILDDAYTVGKQVFAQNDLLYVIEEGLATIQLVTGNADYDQVAHALVFTAANGVVAEGWPTATTSLFIPAIGRAAAAFSNVATNTSTVYTQVIYAFGGLGTNVTKKPA